MRQIRLRSGRMFDPLNPDPKQITIEDIAYGLAGQFRYAGHSRFTVAQHSVLGARYLGNDPAALPFLLHDAEEGLGLPDLSRPVKHDPRFSFYVNSGYILQDAIWFRFNIRMSDHAAQVKFIDDAMLRTEQAQLFGRIPRPDEVILPIKIEVWSPERAEEEFLQTYHLLTSPSTFTTGDYAKSIGLSRHAALVRLTRLETNGIVERVRVRHNQGGIVRPNVLGWQFIGGRSSTQPEEDKTLVNSDSTGHF